MTNAVCLTGQLRSLPIARANWVAGPLRRVIGEHDLFVVMSNSSSFRAWSSLLASLHPIAVEVIEHVALLRSPSAPPIQRHTNGTLALNLARFANISLAHGRDRNAMWLLQFWQMSECARMITAQ